MLQTDLKTMPVNTYSPDTVISVNKNPHIMVYSVNRFLLTCLIYNLYPEGCDNCLYKHPHYFNM